jgi:hypothetical protein
VCFLAQNELYPNYKRGLFSEKELNDE